MNPNKYKSNIFDRCILSFLLRITKILTELRDLIDNMINKWIYWRF